MQNKRSKWKNQFQQIDSSSAFHEKIRSILCTDTFFKSLSCFQEVPLTGLVEGYDSPYHHIDWYIDELGIVIELHGAQHYKIINFGNKAYHAAASDFHNIRYRDNKKKTALLKAGYEYREVSYKDEAKLDANKLREIIFSDQEQHV